MPQEENQHFCYACSNADPMVLVIPVLFWHKAPKRFLLPNAIFRGRTAPTAVSAALGSACPIHNLGPHQPVSASRPHLVSSFQLHQCQHSRMRTPGPRLAVPLTGCCVKSVITVSVGPTNWPISTYAAPNQPQLVALPPSRSSRHTHRACLHQAGLSETQVIL